MSDKPKRDPVSTVSEMMLSLEELYAKIEDGTISESKGNLLLKIRGTQLKTAEIQLRYHRLMKGHVPDPEMRLITKVSDKTA